ncbi:Zinc finger protein 26 [Paragonimus heterotremus]|uniref:Zinc finger protein 26 n=1 Tax=Paragonimus heterotremus TaxID=100268 RepID=A0A8J4T2Q3_9TREM|nr:Zinc finger protein 26 [Paragonimus heterotremus]
MVPDYLFCGTCFVNFRLCDITLFIEHKKSNCATYTNAGSTDLNNSTAGSFVAGFLECVQCFRKFPNALPLLLHVQLEHQRMFATSLGPQLPLQTFAKEIVRPVDTAVGNTVVHSSGMITPDDKGNTMAKSNSDGFPNTDPTQFTSAGTQTNLSSFKSQQLTRKDRIYPPCCAPVLSDDNLTNITSSASEIMQTYVCTESSTRSCGCTTANCTSQDLVVCTCSCFCLSTTSSKSACSPCASLGNPCCPPSPAACTACESTHKSNLNEDNKSSIDKVCCLLTTPSSLTCCSSGNANAISSRRIPTISCCPCPPSAIKVSTISTESQTDFEPEFSSPDYADIAMLLASPVKTTTNSPGPDLDWMFGFDGPRSVSTSSREKEREVPTDLATVQPMTVSSDDSVINLSLPDAVCEQVTNPPRPDLSPTSASFSNPEQEQISTNLCAVSSAEVSSLDATTDFTFDAKLEQPIRTASLSVDLQPRFLVTTIAGSQPSISRQFVCNECGTTYRQKVHLRKHILTQHIQRKPHECPLCSYRTVEKSHLTVHLRTHTGERPFKCRACSYSSTQNCTLKSHYIRKHINSFLFCARCSERFYTELELSKHERMCVFENF